MKKILCKKKKAFTLVELLIVLAVIAILFVVYISKVGFATDKAKLVGVQTDFRSFYIATKAVQMEQPISDIDTASKFETALNKNLDKQLQFTSGKTATKSPFGYPYKVTTKLVGSKLQVLFTTQTNKRSTVYYSMSDLNRSLDSSAATLEGKAAYGGLLDGKSITDLSQSEAAPLAPANEAGSGSGSGGSGGSSSGTGPSTPTTKTLSSISVTTQPTKTTYNAGENFDPAGMVITAHYSDSTSETITGYTVTDGNSLTAGKTSVTISYESKTATVAITVNPVGEAWDTNPVTSDEIKNNIPYYIIDSTTVGIGTARNATKSIYVNNPSASFYFKELRIPTSIDGRKVTEIGDCLFMDYTYLQNIEIPNTVTRIGSSAFSGCTSLNSINVPNSVTYIGYEAFKGCSALLSVSIPSGIETLNANVFGDCTNLNSVSLPDGLKSIGIRAFTGCKNLAEISIPISVTSIGSYAFDSVAHITYTGTATGSPWGALAIN